MDLGMPEETHNIEQGDLEELPAGATACTTATQGSACNDTESFFSGPPLNGTGDRHDATCSPGVHVASTVQDLTLKIKKSLCLLFFRVAKVHKLPHSTTESIFNDFNVTFLDMIRAFAAQIQQNITLESTGNELRVSLACDFMDEIFQAAGSKYQRDQFDKQHLPYVKPEEHVLDVGDTFQYVPITGVLQNLRLPESFCNHFDKDLTAGQSSPLLRSFRVGLVYKETLSALLQDGSQYTLFLVQYSEEVEIVKPLGSKREVHKILVVYFSVINIHARCRSQVRAIHVALVLYKLVDKHGIDAILKPLVADVPALSTTGFTVQKGAATLKVTSILVAFCGDNLSMNRLCGFTCCFNRGHPCRFCTVPYSKLSPIFHEIDVQVRNKTLHRSHVESAKVNQPLSTALYGVKSESPLLGIGYFGMTLQLPPDLMRDLLRGSIPHVLIEVLRGLNSSTVIKYSDLDSITTFSFGTQDKKN
ncbi:unnamed protein product [Ixodes pacificus]